MNFKSTIKGLTKTHGIYILILFGVILFNLNNFISLNELPTIDHSTTYLARNYILKNSFTKYNDLIPLWNPYLMAGTPYFDYAGSPSIFSITWLLALLFPPILATNLNYVLDVILASLMMYILVYYLTKNARAGLVSGMVYGLAGPMIRLFYHGALTQMNGIIITPLLYLFMVRAFKQESIWKFANNAVILGLLFALQARFNPDLKIVLFTSLMFGLFLVFQLVTTRQIARIGLIGIIVGSIFFGMTAQVLLPGQAFLELTSRGHLPYEQSASRKTEIKDLFKTVVEPLYSQALKIRPESKDIKRSSKFEGVFKIGIAATIIILCGIVLKFKNKHTIFLALVALLALSITTGSFVFYLLWKYIPPFDSFRYLERVYSLFLFAAAGLTGLGANAILEKIKWKQIGFVAMGSLIFLNLAIFNMEPTIIHAVADINQLIENNEIQKYISQDKEKFRTHTIETTGIDWTTEYLQIPYKLEGLYGEEGTWLIEYMNTYLGMGLRDPVKFWGILNVKYVTSTKPLEIEGLRLIKQFENCTVCPPIEQHYKAFGPYLYLNEKMMPRTYIVDNAILLVGDKNQQMQAMYALMLDQRFNPATTVIIYTKERIRDYALNDLKKYNTILLTSPIDQDEMFMLEQYTENGGILIPDIIKGKTEIKEEEITQTLKKGSTKKAEYSETDFDHKEVKTDNQKGWLVISEKFSSFPGWHTTNMKKEILKANGIISAVWLDGNEEKLLFEYKPKSYILGTWLMALTIIAIVGYFSYYTFYKRKTTSKVYA